MDDSPSKDGDRLRRASPRVQENGRRSRRAYLRGAGALALAAVAGCLGTGESEGGATPAATTTGEGPGTATATPAPPVAWRASVGAPVTTEPAVGGEWTYAGTEGGTIRRHRTGSDEAGWSYDAGDPIQDLRVTGGTVLAVSGTTELAADHTLLALDAASGAERWTFSPTDWWLELVAVADGAAYVSTADDVLEPTGETLYALALADGATGWTAEVGDPRDGALGPETVVVSAFDRLYAVDRADGGTRWTRDADDPVASTLAVADETVVYAAECADGGSALVGADAATGEQRWRFDGFDVTSTAVRDGTVYAGGGGVAALDPADGSAVWEDDAGGFLTDAGVTADRVYAGGDAGRAYDRESGAVAWTWTPDPDQGGVFAAGVAGDAVLFDAYHDAQPRNQYKFAVDRTGDQRWAFEAGTELTDLALGERVAVAGGENGRLYGLE